MQATTWSSNGYDAELKQDTVSTAQAWLQAIARGDMNRWAELAADEIILTFPFAVAGMPQMCEGKYACRELAGQVAAMLAELVFLDFEFHRSLDDPEVVIAFGRSEAITARGKTYSNDYCFRLSIRDGMVFRHCEIFNPEKVRAAFEQEFT
jgi:uncharacterized protein